MRMSVVHGACIAAVLAAAACRVGLEPEREDLPQLARVLPVSVSDLDAWRLFDRSTSVGYSPSGLPLAIAFDRPETVSAIKVHGAAPYRIHVADPGAGGQEIDVVDISSLGTGWHAFESHAVTPTNGLVLRFEPLGPAGAIDELELWTTADGSAPTVVDPGAATVPVGWQLAAGTTPHAELAAGRCGMFDVPISRPPSQWRRAYLVYRAQGIARPFALERSINAGAHTGGSWIAGDSVARTFVEQIDPTVLRAEINRVRLCAPDDATRTTTVDELRIVGELDRGTGLVVRATVGGSSDGHALLDADPSSAASVAADQQLELEFDRLIAPDAISFTPPPRRDPQVACRDDERTSTSLTVERAGSLLRLDGGSRRCAALIVSFNGPVTLASVDVAGSGAAEPVDWPDVVVTTPAEHFGELAWVGGYVSRPHLMSGATRVDVAGVTESSLLGDFGQLVRRASDPTAPWTIELRAQLPGGSALHRTIVLDRDRHDDLAVGQAALDTAAGSLPATPYGVIGQQVTARATASAAASLRLGARVGLDAPIGAVSAPTDLSLKHLSPSDVPPLDAGMVNVTAPRGHAYEFLPHGQRFAKAVEVTVPFDRSLVPDGLKVDDIHTYYFDGSARRWRQLERRSIDVGEEVVRSATDHFTVMIDAVLATPTHPAPLSFDPTTQSKIPAASPTDGIDLVEPPDANSSGDARLSLPIRLPHGRGAYSPSLEVGYSSSTGDGWLGVGWNIAVSRIEIDTRWGVPTYSAGEEPRYLLDGAEIVPTVDPEGPTCSGGGGRRYHLRVEGAFTHILRCGTDPSNYTFELRDRNGTKFVYGGTGGNAQLASTKPRPGTCSPSPCAPGILRWNLRSATDVDGNATTFDYQLDNLTGAEPGVDVYPKSIAYTSHPHKAAHYTVEFILDSATRSDRIVSGRGGFKLVTRYLLRTVRVKLDAQIIRDYVLTYGHGQFDKSVLSTVRVYGAGGCAAALNAFVAPTCTTGFLDEHRFEYATEAPAFGAVQQWQVQGDPQPTAATLGRGTSQTWSGGISIGVQNDVASLSLGANGSLGTRFELVGMYDVDGNGLVDQVFDTGASTLVLYNQGPTAATFANAGPGVVGLLDLGKEQHSSWGVDANVGISVGGFGASASGGFSHSTARAGRFLTDLDGDGFVDVAAAGSGNGQTLFSTPCAGGQCFAPADFGSTEAVDPNADPLLQAFDSEINEQLVLGDPVVRWIAPYSGRVDLSVLAFVLQPPTTGVHIDLYHHDGLLGTWELNAGQINQLVPSVEVAAGDSVYLRVSTGTDDGVTNNELHDAVFARVEARYLRACADASCAIEVDPTEGRDPTDARVFTFDTSKDTRVHASQPFRAPATGKLNLHGLVTKRVSAADVRYCVQRFPAASTRTDFRCGDPSSPGTLLFGPKLVTQADTSSTTLDVPLVSVSVGDAIVVRAESDYSFDPAAMVLQKHGSTPLIAYSEACLPDDSGDCTVSSDPSVLAQIPIDTAGLGFFSPPVSPPQPAGAIPMPLITPSDFGDQLFFAIAPFPNPLSGAPPIEVAIRSNRQGTMAVFTCGATCTPPAQIETGKGESLSIEVRADPLVLPALASTVTIKLDFHVPFQVPLIFRKKFAEPVDASLPFVGGYRGISASFWNETLPFEPTRLLEDLEDIGSQSLARRREIAISAFAPTAAFDGVPPHTIAPTWVAPGSIAMVNVSALMHAARIGAVGTSGPGAPPVPDGGLFTANYARLSGTRTYYAGAGVQGGDVLPPINFGTNLSGTVSRSTTKTTTDVFDINGDGIADVVAGDRVYAGTLSATPGPVLPGFAFGDGFRRRVGTDYSVGVGASAALPKTTAGGRRLQQDGAEKKSTSIGVSHSVGLAIGRSQMTQDVVDLNGDGLPDLVQRSGNKINVRYNLGTSLGGWETIGTLSGALLTTPVDSFQSTIEAISLFGLTLDSTSNALAHETTLTQTSSRTIDFFFGKTTKSTRTTASRITRQLVDLNGDGLPDLAFKRHGQPIVVQFNRGGDFGPVTTWNTPAWTIPAGPLQLGPTFDAKFDALLIAGTNLLAGPDVLAGTSSQASSSVSGGVSIPVVPGVINVGIDASRANDVDTYELSLIDINGDGSPDHVLRRGQSNDPGRMYVKPNQVTGQANLLKRVRRPLGGTITLAYTSVGNTVELPHRRFVLSSVDVDDGVDLGAAFASPNLVTTFTYQGGRYDRAEKEAFGFAKVTARRFDGVQVERLYDTTTFALRGRLTRETRRDAQNHLLSDHSIAYEVQPVLGPNDVPIVPHTSCLPKLRVGLESCTPRMTVVLREDEARSEDGVVVKVTGSFDLLYDRFGNQTAATNLGDDAVTSDDTRTQTTYRNDTTLWILGRPKSVELRTMIPDRLMRSRTADYDDLGHLKQLSVDTGTEISTTTLGYDEFGNVALVTTPPNEDGQTQTYEVSFDSTVATYPVDVRDGFASVSTAAYDLRFGIATTETDVNGAQLTRQLDAFGRVAAVIGPYDTTGEPGLAMEYHPETSPPSAITVARSGTPGFGAAAPPITAVAFSDGLGRPVELRTTAVVDGVGGMTTSGFVKRDALGRATTTYHPFFTAGASTAFVTPQATRPTTLIYDVQDRVTQRTYPDSAVETTTYSIAATPAGLSMFRTAQTDANGHLRESFADCLGRVRVYLEHPTSTARSETDYDYLATGELSKIVDAERNQTVLEYDLRGLRTRLLNGDVGQIDQAFDLMGNRISEMDSRGRKTTYRYDRDRLVVVDYPSKPDVTYTYGELGAPDGGVGRVVRITDESGEQDNSYGALGELTRSVRTVTRGASAALVFDTRFVTDSFGRLLKVTYPDGEVVTNGYDAAGKLAEVRGAGAGWTRTYADQLRYDVFGNRTHLRFGNGAETTWSFEPQRVRLSTVVTTLPGTSATKIQNLAYTYDPGSNPTQISNTLGVLTAGSGNMPGSSSITLTYDGVDRLRHVVGDAQLDAARTTTYDQLFDYSASHNLITKSREHLIKQGGNTQVPTATNFSSTYTYNPSHPHLPSLVGTLEIQYDPAGNPIRRTDAVAGLDQTLVWDDDSRLVQVTSDGVDQRNVYDASGLRVRRTTRAGETVFASNYFDVENGTSGIKHVFAGDLRIASSLAGFTSGTSPSSPASPGTPYFFHRDHLGSTGVVTTASAAVHQSLEYFADGESWIDHAPQNPINGYLFNGKPLDPDTKLYDYGQRFYDPRTSVWLGVDSAFIQGPQCVVRRPLVLSLSGYAGQSPVRFIDPDGKDWSDPIDVDALLQGELVTTRSSTVVSRIVHIATVLGGVYAVAASAVLDQITRSPEEIAYREEMWSRLEDPDRDGAVFDEELSRFLIDETPMIVGGLRATGQGGSRVSNTTRLGLRRTNAADWRQARDGWDRVGIGDILSKANRAKIANGRTPIVDEAWIEYFPGDAALKGEKIQMHHIGGGPVTVPLPKSRHRDAHMPGGYKTNPGGPGTSG